MNILVVDDHALIRDALRGVLKELANEATVLEAADSRQAMRLVEANPDLHLILLDLNLPDRDGFAVLADLRGRVLTASQRELRNTAVILAEQTDRAFQAVELMQSGLLEIVSARGIATAEYYERLMSGRDVHLMLKDKVAGWPHIGAITLINDLFTADTA